MHDKSREPSALIVVSGAGDLDMLLPPLECPEADMPHPHITVMRPEAGLHMRGL